MKKNSEITMRVGFTKGQVCYLDKLITKIRYSSGKKLTRSQIVRALFNNVKKLNLNVDGITSEKGLSERLLIACQSKV